MDDFQEFPRIPIQLARGRLIASLQVDLDEPILVQFQQDLLNRIQTTGARGVLLDVTGVSVIDLDDFALVKSTIEMASLMGAKCLLVGMQPGVVSALVSMDVDCDGIETAINLEKGFAMLESTVETSQLRPE